MTLHQSNVDETSDHARERDDRTDRHTQDHVMQRLRRLQSELIETARQSAMDAAGVAVADRLNEPMAALLVHLHAIERVRELSSESAPSSDRLLENLRKALSEAQRICDLLDQMRGGAESLIDTQETLMRGRQAVDSWTRSGQMSANDGHIAPNNPVRAHPLTTREEEVLAQITSGATNREGSRRLGISTRTFEAHRAHIMRKLGARNAADLIRVTLTERR
jgi:DNA-binding NarL/FixJ family response regulator